MTYRNLDESAQIAALTAEKDSLRRALDAVHGSQRNALEAVESAQLKAIAAENVALRRALDSAAGGTQRWEYNMMKHYGVSLRSTTEAFDRCGRDGWRLVAFTDAYAVFERPLGAAPKAKP